MPQKNEKTSVGEPKTTPEDRQDSTGRGSGDRPNLNKQQADAADVKKEEKLKLRDGPDNMPELNDNHGVQEDELSLDLNEPTPEVMEYARRELGETDEVKCQTLQEFRDMIYGNSSWNESKRNRENVDEFGENTTSVISGENEWFEKFLS